MMRTTRQYDSTFNRVELKLFESFLFCVPTNGKDVQNNPGVILTRIEILLILCAVLKALNSACNN